MQTLAYSQTLFKQTDAKYWNHLVPDGSNLKGKRLIEQCQAVLLVASSFSRGVLDEKV